MKRLSTQGLRRLAQGPAMLVLATLALDGHAQMPPPTPPIYVPPPTTPTPPPPGGSTSPGIVSIPINGPGGALVGLIELDGQLLPAGTPLAANTPYEAVNAIGKFHAATLARNSSLAAQSVCSANRNEFLTDASEADYAENAAAFLESYSPRQAVAVVKYGDYVLLFAKFQGTEPLPRYYALKRESGALCLTKDLKSDSNSLTLFNFFATSAGLVPNASLEAMKKSMSEARK